MNLKRWLLSIFLLYSLSTNAQYWGGTGDGVGVEGVSNTNASPNIYHGGSNDGISAITVSSQNAEPSIYKGGNNDGVSVGIAISQNANPSIYRGGINDGVASISVFSQNVTPSIYSGGSNDGVAFINVVYQNSTPNIYTGGANDGFGKSIALSANASPNISYGGSGDGYSSLIAVNQNPSVILSLTLDLKLFIEGFYLGNDLLQPVLYNNGLSNDPTFSDSITVKLYDAFNPLLELASVNAKLNTNGKSIVVFPNSVLNHSLYIVVRHRNSIETWSKLPITFGSFNSYDFTITP